MLGNGPTRLKNTRREMKVKEKILAIFPWSGKNPSREKGGERQNHPPGRKRREGKEGGGGEEKRQGKTTGIKGDTIFYSQNKS